MIEGTTCPCCNTQLLVEIGAEIDEIVCQVDVLIPNPQKGLPPLVLFPEECWYGGCCEGVCQRMGAMQLHLPLTQRVRWKRKETGEHFRVTR